MPMPCLTSDFTAILSASDFGESSGTIFIAGQEVKQGIFEVADIEVSTGESAMQIIAQARLTTASEYLPKLADGQAANIGGVDFIVRYWKDDGTGGTEVFFEKVI